MNKSREQQLEFDFVRPSFQDTYSIRKHPDNRLTGVQRLYKYDNGYGASVVRFSYTSNETEWELAVIKWRDDGTFTLGEVYGHLTEAEVEEWLYQISRKEG